MTRIRSWTLVHRLARGFQRLESRLSDILAGAIEADLRDAGYEVLGRTAQNAVIWVDPGAEAGAPAGISLG
ncbi:MAG TPA: hypothetical protein VHL53_07280 [Acidimicrobiia bacterium]|nr:hypothetical protein [Acidimicrobiia bacterium]